MTACAVRVERLERVTADGRTEELRFEPGLNILVGRPNTGKTVWLTMLDYAMGDRDAAEKSLSMELADKYSIVRALLRLGDNGEVVIERRWKEPGSKHKVYVDGHALSVDEFSSYFLPKVGIPVLHYPQGIHIPPELGPNCLGAVCIDTYFGARTLGGVGLWKGSLMEISTRAYCNSWV